MDWVAEYHAWVAEALRQRRRLVMQVDGGASWGDVLIELRGAADRWPVSESERDYHTGLLTLLDDTIAWFKAPSAATRADMDEAERAFQAMEWLHT